MSPARADRARGLFVGAAVGEALGLALEGLNATAAAAAVDERRLTERPELRPGNATLLLVDAAEALLEAAGSPEHLARSFAGRLARWHASPAASSPIHGPTCLEAAGRLAAGVAWNEAAVSWSKGSGSILRAAPCGLLYSRQPGVLRAAASLLASITHGHPTAEVCAVAAAIAVREAIADTPPAFWPDAIARAISGLACGELLDALARMQADPGQGFTAESCLARALAAATQHPENFEAAVLAAVRGGGDTDDVGALTGAVAGARLGLSGIPHRWVAALDGRTAFLDLADRLDLSSG